MSEKKVVRRSVAVMISIVCAALAVALVGAAAYYTSLLKNRDAVLESYVSDYNNLLLQHNYYVSFHSYTDADYLSVRADYYDLLSQHNAYVSTHNYSNSQYLDLLSQYNTSTSPKLSGALSAFDNRSQPQTPYLRITGPVCNVGAEGAYCLLYIEAYQGTVKANSTMIRLGHVEGESIVLVDSILAYTGSALTSWHVWSDPVGIDWWWSA